MKEEGCGEISLRRSVTSGGFKDFKLDKGIKRVGSWRVSWRGGWRESWRFVGLGVRTCTSKICICIIIPFLLEESTSGVEDII